MAERAKNAQARSSGRASTAAKARKGAVRLAKSEMYRGLIIDAAERLFAEQGTGETRMESIAAESGLSLGTVYSVFKGKTDVIAAIHATRLREVLDEAMRSTRPTASPLDMLLSGVRTYIGFFTQRPNYLKMHLREGYAWAIERAAAPTRIQADAWHEGVAMQTDLFRRGIDDGTFHQGDPELMTRMMIAMQQVQLAAWVDGGMSRKPQELIADIEDQVRRSFCRPAL